ncbi:hypothetical protein AAG570_007505 [Ranatra chinensis]|uniref:Uncharacterized protein n=1 Tax=Ranatra chinensis TaxID=642074 RepID=A0ABD0YJT1_9HEMI
MEPVAGEVIALVEDVHFDQVFLLNGTAPDNAVDNDKTAGDASTPVASDYDHNHHRQSSTEPVSALGRHLQPERLWVITVYDYGRAAFVYPRNQLYRDHPQSLRLKMASKRRNTFYKNKKQETTEIA